MRAGNRKSNSEIKIQILFFENLRNRQAALHRTVCRVQARVLHIFAEVVVAKAAHRLGVSGRQTSETVGTSCTIIVIRAALPDSTHRDNINLEHPAGQHQP